MNCNDEFHVFDSTTADGAAACKCGKFIVTREKCPTCGKDITLTREIKVSMSMGSRRERVEKLLREYS